MSLVRGKGNKATELVLAKHFRAHGIKGWRRHYAVVGKPDFAFPRQRIAVFVDGCFWHRCPKHGRLPRSNRSFWIPKLEQNKARDRRTTRALRAQQWRVVRIWEHELRDPEAALRRVLRAIERNNG